MFFEAEFPRAVEFEQDGGPAFNTDVQATQSGQEQRNRIWQFTSGDYTASIVGAEQPAGSTAALIKAVRAFFLVLGGRADGFRYFDPIDNTATGEPMAEIDSLHWQLQITYTVGSRSYVRTITKPIGPGAVDYKGNALAETVVIHGGTPSSIDHTTGIVTFASPPGGSPVVTPTADFQYHIPVRLNTDKFTPKISKSAKGNRIMRWNLGLVIVRPPNY